MMLGQSVTFTLKQKTLGSFEYPGQNRKHWSKQYYSRQRSTKQKTDFFLKEVRIFFVETA